jgi:hypothetical protein
MNLVTIQYKGNKEWFHVIKRFEEANAMVATCKGNIFFITKNSYDYYHNIYNINDVKERIQEVKSEKWRDQDYKLKTLELLDIAYVIMISEIRESRIEYIIEEDPYKYLILAC